MRSRIAGSAWSRSQFGVSMMWASASCTTRPVVLYTIAPVSPQRAAAHTVATCATPTSRPLKWRCSCTHHRIGCGRSSATSTCPLGSRASSSVPNGSTQGLCRRPFEGSNEHPAIGEWETTSVVTRCEPERVFEWAVGDPEYPSARWRFELAPVDGGVRLRSGARWGRRRRACRSRSRRCPTRRSGSSPAGSTSTAPTCRPPSRASRQLAEAAQ